MTQINDIITDEIGSVYAETALWCNRNKAMLEEIEAKDGIRRFKIIPVPEPTEEELRTARIVELQNFLNATDWYAVRFAETGVAIPEDVKAERQAAREEISRLREGFAG